MLGLSVFGLAQAQQLGQVVVTATRDERVIERTLADVTVIDSTQIAASGMASLPELLSTYGGIEISQNGSGGSTAGVFVRGTKTSQTVVLIDGVRLENPTSGTANLEFLPLSAIDRIEVVRGPLSSLYGSGAMGGVIQIFTRQGGAGFQPTASVGYGSRNTAQARLGLSGSIGESGATRYSIGVAGDRTAGHEISLPSSPNYQSDRDGNSQGSVNGSLVHTLKSGWRLGANLFSTSGRVEYDDVYSQPGQARMHYRTAAATGFLKGRLSPHWQTDLSFGQTQIAYRFETFTFAPRAQTTSLAWQNRYTLPRGRLLFGLEQVNQRLSGEGVVTGPWAYLNDSRKTDSAFVGYELAIREHLLRFQARHDHIEGFGSEPTGTLAYGYQLTPYWLLRASLASAFRAPTFDDLFSPLGSNPDLVPERSRGSELALEYREGGALFKATLFQSRIRNAIELDPFYTPQNINSARVEGISFEARQRVGRVYLRGAVTFQDPRGERFDPDSAELVSGQLARRARRFASLGAQMPIGAGRLGADWMLQANRQESNGKPIAGYGVVNLYASYPVTRQWESFVRLGNLSDKIYETASGYRMPPRSLFVGMRVLMR